MHYSVPYPAAPTDAEMQENQNTVEMDTSVPIPSYETGELFPEPEIQKLLIEIAGDLDEVDRFVNKLNTELASEQEPKPRFTLERRKSIFK
jgi:hypothetical protein